MKKIIYLILLTLISTVSFSQVHNNVRIHPKEDTVCYNSNLNLWIAGQSFQPISYLWSNGSTAPTIQAITSGSYTLTVTGYLGNSSKVITLTKTKDVVVTPKPELTPTTPLWVCKLDTVRIDAVGYYNNITWSDGQIGQTFEHVFSSVGTGGAIPDTMSVWYTAQLPHCSTNSDTVMIRGIRRPEGLGGLFCGLTNMDTSQFVRSGIVLEYMYQNQYEMEFTDMNDTSSKVTYITQLGSRRAPLNILLPGHSYYVRTRPIINGQTFCWGDTCTLGIVMSPSNFDTWEFMRTSDHKVFQVYDMTGRFIFQREGSIFDRYWLQDYPNQVYIIVTINENNMIEKSEKINQVR